MKTEQLTDAHGKAREVVLCNAGLPPQVKLRSSTEVAHTVHHLRPETHLRQQQGAEWEAQVHEWAAEGAASHPMAGALTVMQLQENLGVNLPP